MLKKLPLLPLSLTPPHPPRNTTTTIKSVCPVAGFVQTYSTEASVGPITGPVCALPQPSVFAWAASAHSARRLISSGTNCPGRTLISLQWASLGLWCAPQHLCWFYWAQHPRVGTLILPFLLRVVTLNLKKKIVVFAFWLVAGLHFCSTELHVSAFIWPVDLLTLNTES